MLPETRDAGAAGVRWVKVTVMCLGAAARGGEAERAPLTLADPTERKDTTVIPLGSPWVCTVFNLEGLSLF